MISPSFFIKNAACRARGVGVEKMKIFSISPKVLSTQAGSIHFGYVWAENTKMYTLAFRTNVRDRSLRFSHQDLSHCTFVHSLYREMLSPESRSMLRQGEGLRPREPQRAERQLLSCAKPLLFMRVDHYSFWHIRFAVPIIFCGHFP